MIVSELASSRVGEFAGHGETDTPDCSWLMSGKSYEQALLGPERNGREKEKFPLDPLKRKREGKENRPVSKRTGLSRGRARALVDAALDEAVAWFGGTAKDRSIWARIAWRVGADLFHEAAEQARSEIDSHSNPPDSSEHPRIFQNVLNDRFPKDSSFAKATAAALRAMAVKTEDRGGAA